MTKLETSKSDVFGTHAEELLDRFDAIIKSFEPPQPLHVEKFELQQITAQSLNRDLKKVYEDDECIIYMDV